MNRPAFLEHNDAVAWLILGYLCSHPDAKDTAAGIGQWWLQHDIRTGAQHLRTTLDYLVVQGWLTSVRVESVGTIYGLNQEKLLVLRGLFPQ